MFHLYNNLMIYNNLGYNVKLCYTLFAYSVVCAVWIVKSRVFSSFLGLSERCHERAGSQRKHWLIVSYDSSRSGIRPGGIPARNTVFLPTGDNILISPWNRHLGKIDGLCLKCCMVWHRMEKTRPGRPCLKHTQHFVQKRKKKVNWHVTHEIWQVTGGRRLTFSRNLSPLASQMSM